jgi:hypothetical protein
MKWAKSQIDMGRTVSIPEFAEFCNAKTHDDKNIIDLELTPAFTEYHNIHFEVNLKFKSSLTVSRILTSRRSTRQ